MLIEIESKPSKNKAFYIKESNIEQNVQIET